MIKPKRLKPGDTIVVVSPSAGSAHRFPHVFDRGLDVLRNTFGFKIKEYPTARMSSEQLHDNPRARAEDINAAFADKEVDGIIHSKGISACKGYCQGSKGCSWQGQNNIQAMKNASWTRRS